MDSITEKDEKEALEQFVYQLSLENAFGDGIVVSENEAFMFLMARKFDVGRAISLYHASKIMRGRFELEDLNTSEAPLATELNSGKFTVVCKNDRTTLCIFYAHKHFPKLVDHITVLKSIVFQLDCVMKRQDAQRKGLTFIYNMEKAGYMNFDFDLAMKVLHLLKGGYPARLKHIYVVGAPLWFRATLTILSGFLKDKIRDRVEVIRDVSALSEHIPKQSLPIDMEGTLLHDHFAWLQHCSDVSRLPQDSTENIPKLDLPQAISNGISDDEPPPLPPRPSNSAPTKSLPPPPVEDIADESAAMSLPDFLAYVKSVDRKGIHIEYTELRAQAPTGTFESTLLEANLKKNRYNNILAFEETRLHLSIVDDNPLSDYINANYVDSFVTPRKFICTQGPTPHTFTDFWRMVWEEEVVIIVMITRCVERGRLKCGQYWPGDPNQSESFEHLTVDNVASDPQDHFTTTLLNITDTRSGNVRRVFHIQFTSWPDFGVLHSAYPILDVFEYIKLCQKEERRYSPIVVHCSAGVGRTGTFCSLNNCVEQYETEASVDIYTCVQKIRQQRAFSVQTAEQYEFIYTGFIEYLIRQDEPLEAFLQQLANAPLTSDSE